MSLPGAVGHFFSVSPSSALGSKSITSPPPPPPPSTHANMMHCHDSSKCNMIALVMKLYLFVWSSLQLQSCRNLRACKRMPPSDGRLSLPRSRDGTGLQLLWSRLLQPPTRCRLWEVLKIARVDLLNRFNNSAYKLNLLLGFFFSPPAFLPSFLPQVQV